MHVQVVDLQKRRRSGGPRLYLRLRFHSPDSKTVRQRFFLVLQRLRCKPINHAQEADASFRGGQ